MLNVAKDGSNSGGALLVQRGGAADAHPLCILKHLSSTSYKNPTARASRQAAAIPGHRRGGGLLPSTIEGRR